MFGNPLTYIFTVLGSIIGGYIPALLGADIFSMWSLLGSGLGSMIGIVLAYKINNY